jgi:hypothetical protein
MGPSLKENGYVMLTVVLHDWCDANDLIKRRRAGKG